MIICCFDMALKSDNTVQIEDCGAEYAEFYVIVYRRAIMFFVA